MQSLAATLAVFLTASPALAAPVHIIAFGDSFTSGWLVPRHQAYPAQLQAALHAEGYDVVVKNAGVPGDTDICIVEFGINDCRHGAPLRSVHTRVSEIVRSLRVRRIEVLVLGLGSLRFDKLAAAHDALPLDFTLRPQRYRARDGAHFNAQGYALLVRRMLPQVERLIRRVRSAPR